MGLLGSLVKSSIEGVVIELDKGNTPYVVGEEVISLTRSFIYSVFTLCSSLYKSHQKYLYLFKCD